MRWGELGHRREWVVGIFLFSMMVCNLVVVFEVLPELRNGYQDFTIFYAAGKLLRSGQAGLLYNLPAQYRVEQEFAPNVRIRQGALPYNHPPFEALVFVPFAGFGYLAAYSIWTALNVGMVAVGLALLQNEFATVRQFFSPALLGLTAAGFLPAIIGLVQGQDSILLLFVCVLALVLLHRQRDFAAGAVLALGLFRFQLVIPLLVLLAVRRLRVVWGFAPSALALCGISWVMLGRAGIVGYIRFILNLESTGAGGAIQFWRMPNLHGLIATAAGVHVGGMIVVGLVVLASLALCATAGWKIWAGPESPEYAFALASVTSVLVSYHALTHDLTLLLPAAIFLFCGVDSAEARDQRIDLALLFLLFFTPLYLLLWFQVGEMCWVGLLLLWMFWTAQSKYRENNRLQGV